MGEAMLPEPFNSRLQMLQSHFVDTVYVKAYYGLEDPSQYPDLLPDLATVKATLRNSPPDQPGKINRVTLEALFSAKHLQPKKWAAARLGMNEQLFDTVYDKRKALPIPMRRSYVEYDCLMDESFFDDLNG